MSNSEITFYFCLKYTEVLFAAYKNFHLDKRFSDKAFCVPKLLKYFDD